MYTRIENESKSHRQIFIGLYVKDSRLILGVDYYKDPLYATPLAFDIVTEEELQAATKAVSSCITEGTTTEILVHSLLQSIAIIYFFVPSFLLIHLFTSYLIICIFVCFLICHIFDDEKDEFPFLQLFED